MNKSSFSVTWFQRISDEEKINFARHLSIIIRAGVPMIEGLRIIRKQTKKGTMRMVLDHLVESVNAGQSLAHGLHAYDHLFEPFFISIVEVGEVSGTLAQNLLYLSEELKKVKGLKGKVRAAMIYPVILFIATIAISAFLTFFIFPKIIEAFTQLNVKLPAVTVALIAILGFLRAYGVYLAIGFVLLWILFRMSLRLRPMKYFVSSIIIRMPVVAGLSIHMNVASASRLLSILLKSGVKIVDAMLIVSRTFSNLVYERAFREAADGVRKGESLAEALFKTPRIFPPIFAAMVEVGENTGNLEDNLSYLAEYYSEEVDGSLRNLTAVIEPLLIMFMGLLVGFVALSIITPIYSISQGVRQ
jgi:type IV pilus assembly protein PilC